MINIKDEQEMFLVTPEMTAELVGECTYYTLFTAVSSTGVVTLWPVRLPGADGKDMAWWSSARQAAEMGKNNWVRLQSNRSLGAYEITKAEGMITEPKWPIETFQEILRIAFKDHLIENVDNIIVKRLRGLA